MSRFEAAPCLPTLMGNRANHKHNNRLLVYSIVGVLVLIAVVAGSAYAFYAATASNTSTVNGTAGGGAAPILTVTKKSTSATGNLIPIDNDVTTLTKGAKGYGNSGSSFDATKACKDKNGYSVCQIYSVKVQNKSNVAQTFDIKLTSLNGGSTMPYLDAVAMESAISVTANTSIKSNGLICQTGSLAYNTESSECYFMVFIKNHSAAQTDNGTFTGTVTATSTNGAQIKATF